MTTPELNPLTPRSREFAGRLADRMANGVLGFPLTPFTADGERVDLDAFRAHLRTHLDSAVGAVFVACGTGEFPALTEDEYDQVVTAAVAETAGAVPVLAGAGYGWAQARRFAAIAERAGVDGLLVMPPYLARGNQAGLVEQVRRLAAASPLPLIVYQRDIAAYTTESLVELATLDTVIGLKDGHSNFVELQRMCLAMGNDFLFFNGSLTAEMQYRPYASVGIPAYSSAVQSFAPEISRAFFLAAQAHDTARMDELLTGFYSPLVALRDRVPGYAVSLVKAGARLRGQQVGSVRAPLVDPDEKDLAELSRIIDAGLALVG